jgi:hypothetical protein
MRLIARFPGCALFAIVVVLVAIAQLTHSVGWGVAAFLAFGCWCEYLRQDHAEQTIANAIRRSDDD